MRYIGSKRQVLPFIQKTIADTYGDFSNAVIGDLFAGTACVSEMFKKTGATVISNDYMNFSYALQVEKVKLNSVPESIPSYDDLLLRLNQCAGSSPFNRTSASRDNREADFFASKSFKYYYL